MQRYLEAVDREARRCGETTELEDRGPIANTPPHLSRHPMGIREKERFWLEDHKKRVREYEMVPGREVPHICVDLRSHGKYE
jgi:hypothetical protein